MLSIIVCMKLVLDPEAPTSTYRVDTEAKRVIQQGLPPVLNPFDENALEAALRIKDTQQSKITVLSMGNAISKAIVRKALAVGADQVILLEDSAFESLDAHASASILAAAIRKIGEFDIIFTGMQAADTNAGVVGSGIAEILEIPSITIVRKGEVNDGMIRVERIVSDGYEVVEVPTPALVTVSNSLGELRSVDIRKMMAAQKKPIKSWSAKDLGVQPAEMGRTKLVDVFIPHKEVDCEFIEGGDEEESGRNLAAKLRETGII